MSFSRLSFECRLVLREMTDWPAWKGVFWPFGSTRLHKLAYVSYYLGLASLCLLGKWIVCAPGLPTPGTGDAAALPEAWKAAYIGWALLLTAAVACGIAARRFLMGRLGLVIEGGVAVAVALLYL